MSSTVSRTISSENPDTAKNFSAMNLLKRLAAMPPPSKEETERFKADKMRIDWEQQQKNHYKQQTTLPDADKDKCLKKMAMEALDQEGLRCIRMVDSWEVSDGMGIFLHGLPGNAKTHMIKALINKHYSPYQTFHFVECPTLLGSLTGSYAEIEYQHQRMLAQWALVIDDFGSEKSREHDHTQLFTLLNNRMKEKRLTFMTSNLTTAQLAERYHPRIISRLGEMMVFIENHGKSWRKEIQSTAQNILEARYENKYGVANALGNDTNINDFTHRHEQPLRVVDAK